EQRENLLRFLRQHERPERFVPAEAKVVGTAPANLNLTKNSPPDQPIKQYTVQILTHRPVPGQEEVKQVDVYYYRPNPENGKPGITIKHTVDLANGNQIGPTEVLLNRHSPLAREEVAEAVELAKAKSQAVQNLYKDRAKEAVQWEYLQMFINRKHEQYDLG